jgi:hypothetical protein
MILSVGESQFDYIVIIFPPCFNPVTSWSTLVPPCYWEMSNRVSEVGEVHFIIGKRIRSYLYDQTFVQRDRVILQYTESSACSMFASSEWWDGLDVAELAILVTRRADPLTFEYGKTRAIWNVWGNEKENCFPMQLIPKDVNVWRKNAGKVSFWDMARLN